LTVGGFDTEDTILRVYPAANGVAIAAVGKLAKED